MKRNKEEQIWKQQAMGDGQLVGNMTDVVHVQP